MAKINSKQKGKVGEAEVVHILKEHGFEDARRTAQYCGMSGDAADVIGLPGFHLEVKRQERLSIWDWIEQAERDHKEGTIPIVVFRKSRKKWQVCLDFEQFLELIKEMPIGGSHK